MIEITRLNDIINRIIEQDEGGWEFTDHAWDAGGMTFAGVTFRTYQRVIDSDISTEDFRTFAKQALHDPDHWFRDRIRGCYFSLLRNAKLGLVPYHMQPAFVSCVVVFGADDATWCIQNVCNETLAVRHDYTALKCDGVWGPKTTETVSELCRMAEGIVGLRMGVDMAKLFCHYWMLRHVEKTIDNTERWFAFYESNGADARPSGKFNKTLQGWINRVERYRREL